MINALSLGFYWLGFAVFFLPIGRDLHISRAAASLPFTLRSAVAVVQAPVIGLLVDRVGPSKVLFLSAFIGGIGYLLLSQVSNYAWFMVIFLLVVTPGMIPFDAPTTTVTSRWFNKKRGRAMALSYMGFAFGGAVLTPLLALSIDRFGWRISSFMVGLIIWTVALPLATRLYRNPESQGLKPDGVSHNQNGVLQGNVSTSEATFSDVRVRDVLKTRTYWLLCATCGFRGTVFSAMGLHLVAIMAWKGLDEAAAGILVGAFAFIWMVSAFVLGWAGDRWSRTRVAALPAFIASLSFTALILMDQVEIWQMVLILTLWATNEGTWSLNFAILADQFGLRNFGTLRGGMLMVINLMSLGAPFYSGWVFDETQSYLWVLLPAAILLALAGLLNWFLPEVERSQSPVKAS